MRTVGRTLPSAIHPVKAVSDYVSDYVRIRLGEENKSLDSPA
jgi:hypothetical protein